MRPHRGSETARQDAQTLRGFFRTYKVHAMNGMQRGGRRAHRGSLDVVAVSRRARVDHAAPSCCTELARPTTSPVRHVITARRPQAALSPLAVTPTLYFHANTNAAVALIVGVESVAIGPARAAADDWTVSLSPPCVGHR